MKSCHVTAGLLNGWPECARVRHESDKSGSTAHLQELILLPGNRVPTGADVAEGLQLPAAAVGRPPWSTATAASARRGAVSGSAC